MKDKHVIDAQRARGGAAAQIRNAALSLAVMIGLTAAVYFFNIPNPNMILIAGLTVCTSLFGYVSGIVCGVEMIVYSMFFFSTDHSFFQYTDINLQKIGIIVLGVVLNVAFIGRLKRRHNEATRQLTRMNDELETDNLLLQEASETDVLTGVKNRYALRRDYDGYQGQSLHVMMIDLDGFKQINDTFGHEVGDFILNRAGQVLRETFGSECCYRYGGDEFLVVCRDIAHEDFIGRVDKVKLGFENVELDGRRLPFSFSGGFVNGKAEMPFDLRLMIRQADHEMYNAKHRGKDFCLGSEFSRERARMLDQHRGFARLNTY